MRHFIACALLLVWSTTGVAQTTLPYTFTAGTAAKASEVNANFQALLTAINRLEGAVTPAGIPGTYALSALGFLISSSPQVGTSSNVGRVEQNLTSGTAVLNADGTLSLSMTTSNNSALKFDFFQTTMNSTPVVQQASVVTQTNNSPPGVIGGTWTLSGNTLTINLSDGGTAKFTAVQGGKLFIGVDPQQDSPTSQQLTILIRTN